MKEEFGNTIGHHRQRYSAPRLGPSQNLASASNSIINRGKCHPSCSYHATNRVDVSEDGTRSSLSDLEGQSGHIPFWMKGSVCFIIDPRYGLHVRNVQKYHQVARPRRKSIKDIFSSVLAKHY